MRIANIGNEALFATHGTKYRVGSIRETLYVLNSQKNLKSQVTPFPLKNN